MADNIPFREWLISRLMGTVHVRVPLTDQSLDQTATMLGIQPDVLAEARVRFKTECKQHGIQPPLGDKRKGSRHFQIKCKMPEAIYALWKVHIAERGIEGSALLRSLIHGYLLSSAEPTLLLGYWVWKGRRLSEVHEKRGASFRERSLITQGSRRALERRAERLGCTASAVMRGLVLDCLQGHHPHVRLVDARTMFDDEDRYLGTLK